MTKKFIPKHHKIDDKKKVTLNFLKIIFSIFILFFFVLIFILIINFYNTELTSKQDYIGAAVSACAYMCNTIKDYTPNDISAIQNSNYCEKTFTYVLTPKGKFEEKTKYPVSKWRVFNCWDWPISYDCNLDKLAKKAREFC